LVIGKTTILPQGYELLPHAFHLLVSADITEFHDDDDDDDDDM